MTLAYALLRYDACFASSQQPQPHFDIFVMHEGTNIINVSHEMTVWELKHIIAQRKGLPVLLQFLTVGGRPMYDGELLSFYELQKDSTVRVHLRFLRPVIFFM